MLTDTKLRSLKPQDKLYKVNDRDGLYVAVTPAGSISFRYNYSINGRQETITFGLSLFAVMEPPVFGVMAPLGGAVFRARTGG